MIRSLGAPNHRRDPIPHSVEEKLEAIDATPLHGSIFGTIFVDADYVRNRAVLFDDPSYFVFYEAPRHGISIDGFDVAFHIIRTENRLSVGIPLGMHNECIGMIKRTEPSPLPRLAYTAGNRFVDGVYNPSNGAYVR